MTDKYIGVALETTGPRLGISVFEATGSGPKLRANTFRNIGRQQAELLIPELERLLKKARVSKQNIMLLAVDVGPGSFTGVRIGVATARALAQALRVPLVGVSSLEAMARFVRDEKKEQTIVTCIPALQGEVYYAGFLSRPGAFLVKQAPVWEKLEELESYLKSLSKKNDVLVAVENWRDDLVALKKRFPLYQWVSKPVFPNSTMIGRAALEAYRANPSMFYFENVVPLYLQPSWAERKRDADACSK